VFSVGSVPICYKQDKLSVAVSELENCCGSVLVSCCCEKPVAITLGPFGNPEEGERPLLKPLTSNGREDVTENTSLCMTVICKVQS
jgi:hypothetical protein